MNEEEFIEQMSGIYKMDKIGKRLFRSGIKRFDRMSKIIRLYNIPNKNRQEMYNKCTRSFDIHHSYTY